MEFLLFLPFVAVFIFSLSHPFDPDLGWHLKYGEYFFKNWHPLKENTFSTEMPGYLWPNSSWGTDLISYLTFSHFGFLGLAILGSLVITLTFFFFSKAARLGYFEQALIFPLILYFLKPVNYVSFRGQLLSLLFLGILFYVLTDYEETKTKKIFFIIPLFWLWSNIHGQFLLGIVLFLIWIFAYSTKEVLSLGWQNRKKILKEAAFLVGLLTTAMIAALINPFGVDVYREALGHSRNPLQRYIAEWLPPEELSARWWNQSIMGLLLFFGLVFAFFNNQIKQKITFIPIVLLLSAVAFSVRRYAWPTYYLGMTIIAPVATFLKPPSEKIARISATIILLIFILATVILGKPRQQISNMSWESYCLQFTGCSSGAVEFLVKNDIPREILLTFYDWGGYIIWNYPQIKPSIDGRMHLWRDEAGYSAFENYYALEQNWLDVNQSKYDVVLMSPNKPLYTRLIELVKEGKWQLVYQDRFSGIFVRRGGNSGSDTGDYYSP